jgi:hypothetical protein
MKMMMERLEIAFWDVSIPLRRESSLVQAMLPAALEVLRRGKGLGNIGSLLAPHKSRILFWAWTGLILGLIAGFLSARVG